MNDCQYIRVGTQYFKIARFPLLSGDLAERLIPWNYDTIRHDEGAPFLSQVPKYDGFCVLPEHINFKKTVENYLNRYQPLEYIPKEGDIQTTENFLKHLFGDQYDLELDYLTILYKHPIERLPIQLLVSKERETGKTTYLNWLKKIFGGNTTFNTNEDFRNNFNSHWAYMLIIMIDEVLLEKQEDSERIKNLSTARNYKAESKGVDKIEVEFFSKFILCSNNEENGIVIHPGETRYWVRKIPSIKFKDPLLLDKLFGEISSFIYFLRERKINSPKVSRMWFSYEQIKTQALLRIINNYRSKLEVEAILIFREIMDAANLNDFHFTNKDLLGLIYRTNEKIDRIKITKLLQHHWGLKPTDNSLTYNTYRYDSDDNLVNHSFVGRYYSISKEWIDKKYDELMN